MKIACSLSSMCNNFIEILIKLPELTIGLCSVDTLEYVKHPTSTWPDKGFGYEMFDMPIGRSAPDKSIQQGKREENL